MVGVRCCYNCHDSISNSDQESPSSEVGLGGTERAFAISFAPPKHAHDVSETRDDYKRKDFWQTGLDRFTTNFLNLDMQNRLLGTSSISAILELDNG